MSTSASPTPFAPSWPVVASLAWRELVRFFRQPHRVFGALGQPIIFWLLFSEGLKSRQLDYGFFFPGTLAMILLFTAIFATISIIEDRNEGFLQGVLVAPVTRWSMVLGKVLGGATIAWLQAMLFLVLGLVTMADLHATAAGVVGASLLMALVAVALTALGFVLAWRNDSTQGYHAMMSVLLFPMWLLAIFPASSGSLVSYAVRANPLAYTVVGLRHYLEQGTPPELLFASLGTCWIVCGGFALAMLVASIAVAATRTQGDLR